MELRQLIYFKRVAELEHITRASEELDTSQPFLSKTISDLEDELGISLFDHIGRSIRLNQYGKLFYKRVCRGLQEFEDGKRELQDLYVESETQVRIVTNSSLYMPEILSRFHKYYPHIQLSQMSAKRHGIIEMLMKDDVDFAISSPELTEEECFENKILIHETCSIIYPKRHWLSGRKSVALQELVQENFITAPKGFALRDQSDLFFKEAGFRPTYVIQSTDTYNIPVFVDQGLGIAFTPQLFLKYHPEMKKQSIEITYPKCEGEVTLAWKKDRYLNQSCQIFRDFIIRYFED